MGNVISLAETTQDATYCSPEEMLERALKDVINGEIKGPKAILLVLDEGSSGGKYVVDYRNAGMKKSEVIALLQTMVVRISREILGA